MADHRAPTPAVSAAATARRLPLAAAAPPLCRILPFLVLDARVRAQPNLPKGRVTRGESTDRTRDLRSAQEFQAAVPDHLEPIPAFLPPAQALVQPFARADDDATSAEFGLAPYSEQEEVEEVVAGIRRLLDRAGVESRTRFTPPAGQTTHCEGLEFAAMPNPFFANHAVFVTSGMATFAQCTLRAAILPALTVDQARVHLQDCTVECVGTASSSPALAATAGAISAVRSSLRASQSTLALPGPAVRLRSATLQGSRLLLLGGAVLFGGPGGTALDLDATSSAWISDSQLTGGGTTCPVVNNGGSGRIDRSVLLPSIAICTSLPSALVLGIDSTTPPQTGAAFVVDFRTAPNQLIGIYASSSLGNGSLPGLADQPLGLDLANAWFGGLVTADANGFASAAWTLPNGPFAGLPLFVLGVGLAPPRVELSPPVGGVVR